MNNLKLLISREELVFRGSTSVSQSGRMSRQLLHHAYSSD